LKKLAVDESALLKLLNRWREGLDAAWELDCSVGAATVEKTVFLAVTILEKADNLSLFVDFLGDAIGAAWGINRLVAQCG
jgi:hypothetical protein